LKASYKLTNAADKDFEGIFVYGIETFGFNQALDYQNALQQRFADIAEAPSQYQKVDDILQGYHRSVFKAHSIYFQVFEDYVLIVRILGRQDLSNAFSNI